ncbi:MAG: calcium-binding protein [Pseudomonadota bacterium]
MARIKARTAFNLDTFEVLNDDPSVANNGFIRVISGNLTGEYSGPFRINNDESLSGSLAKYELFESGVLQATVTQINRDAQRFADTLDLGSGSALQNFVLNGDDKFILSGSDDKARGRSGDDLLKGKNGDDKLRGDGGDDRVFGNAGNDKVAGNGGNDVVKGGGGDDKVLGGGGSDRVIGNGGNDKVKGGGGSDTIIGGAGDDTLTGGGGPDVFVFGRNDGSDTIRDFVVGVDDIEFNGSATNSDLSITDDGNDAIITFADTTIRLLGVDSQDINVLDFLS